MRVKCLHCQEMETLSPDVNKYIDRESYICSAACLLSFIKEYKKTHKQLPASCPCLTYDNDTGDCGNISCVSEMLHMTFRSRYEAQVCEFLHTHGISFQYEPFRFLFPHKHGDVTWMPDLYLPKQDLFLEVKGAKGVGFRKKLECFREFMDQEVIVVHWAMEDTFPELYDPIAAFFGDDI